MQYLSLLLLGGVDDGGAAHFGDLAALAVEGPAADLVPDDVLDEEHASVEPQRQLVEELDVLQHVVVRVAAWRRIVSPTQETVTVAAFHSGYEQQ